MALSESGILFVGTREVGGSVYAVLDSNSDYTADEVVIVASGLNMPNGVAINNGDLYVAEVHRVLRYPRIESRLDDPPLPDEDQPLRDTQGEVGVGPVTDDGQIGAGAPQRGSAQRDRLRWFLGKRLLDPRIAVQADMLVVQHRIRIGDRRGEGNHLGNLGNAYSDLGQVETDGDCWGAIEYYEQALAI